MTEINTTLQTVTDRIIERSSPFRNDYLDQLERSKQNRPRRTTLSCTNFAHAIAAAPADDKLTLHRQLAINIGIVSAYNDMLSAHQPFERFPAIIKETARSLRAACQQCATA